MSLEPDRVAELVASAYYVEKGQFLSPVDVFVALRLADAIRRAADEAAAQERTRQQQLVCQHCGAMMFTTDLRWYSHPEPVCDKAEKQEKRCYLLLRAQWEVQQS